MARWEHGRLGLILGILATAGCIRSAPELPSRPEGAVISGQVVQRGGPSGDWVPATGVSVTVAGLGVTASTNADGAFRLERLPVNHIMTVRLTAVRTSTDAPIQRRVLDPVRPILDRAALDLGTLRLGPGGDLTGRALVRETAEGAAAGVGGTLVVLTQTAFKAVTDEAGHFQLPDLPEGNFDLVAFRPGYLPARQGGVAVLPGGTVTAKDLILQRGDAPDVVVSGSARILGDASDTGHSGITVRFAVDGAETPSAEVTTGPDGRYAVSLAPGVYYVTATRDGFGKVLLEGVAVLPEGVLGLVDIYLSAPTDGDFDGDGVPDSVDEDDDNDGCIDAFDAFDLDPAFCLDTDEDGIANEIDDDDDGDGLPDSEEVSEGADGWVTSPLVADTDDDGYRDALDVCPTVPDDQTDSDGDGIGDACDDDELPPTGYPDPVIDRFSPTEAGVGTVLTIHGSFLDDPVNVPPLIQLRFLGQTGGSGVLSGPPLAVSPGQLQFEVPPGATTGLLQLFTHGRSTTSTSALIILPSPDVVTMSPASGRRGSRVVVLGHSFLEDDLAAYVNGVQATLLPFASGALVETRVQAGQLYDALQLEVPDTVTGPLEIRNRFGFDQAPAPFEITDAGIVIDLVNPNPAAAGGQISLLGHGFSTRDLVAPPVPEVIFNYGGAELRQPLNPDWSDTQATVMVPSGVTTGPIALAHPGAASPVVYRDTLQVVPDLPYVIDADPLLVSPGDSLTLIGGNLAGVTTVTLGGGVTVGGAGLITSAGSVQLTVPAGVQPGPVTVQGPSGAGTSPFRLGVVVVSATVPLSGLGTVKAGGGFGPGASEFYLVIRPLTGSDFIQVVTATSATPGLARQLPPPAGAEGERFLSLSIAPSGTVGILQTLQDRTFVVTIPGFQTIGVCPYGRSANLLEPKFGYDPTNTVAFGLLPYQGSEGVLRIDLGTGGCERLVTLPQAAPTTNSLYGVLPLSAGSLLVTHSILGAAILDVDLQSPLYGTLTTPWTAPAIPPSRLLRGPGTAVFLEGAQAGLGYFEPLAGTPPQFFTGLGSNARGLADGAQRYLLTSTGHVIDMTSPPRLLRGGLDVGLDLPGSGNAVVGASIPGTHTFFTLNTAGDGLVRVDIYP